MIELKYLDPFIIGIRNVLENFEQGNVEVGKIQEKPSLTSANEISILIGLVKDVKGSVTFSMSYEVAKGIVSLMLGGMPVEDFDTLAKSAICEFANMSSGQSLSEFGKLEKFVDITTPTLIHGKNLSTMLSRVKTTSVEVLTAVGNIEVNLSVESGL